MKIAYITAGAANMFCGSCMHDNTLVAALMRQGHDALLVPTYTPIRTDEADVSQKRVFFGGINVYLQQKFALFRHTPRLFDRLLDAPGLLRWVGRFAMKTDAEELGDLTISVLRGEHGHQRKEITKLVDWLAAEVRPEIINLSNVLLSGLVHEMKERLEAPVLGTLQGDDIFLEALPEKQRGAAIDLVREHCRELDGFLTTSGYYADFMGEYLQIPRERIHLVYPGLNLRAYQSAPPSRNGSAFTLGYFARICPEKGLHVLAEAFHLLQQSVPGMPCCLRVSGWLGANNHAYFNDIKQRFQSWGLADRLVHVESPDQAAKIRFFREIDVLSVPTIYREPKGLYVLEAWASGVPVVQPRHGSFPELVEATGGGLLVNPNDPADLARALRRLAEEPGLRRELGQKGKAAVHDRFHDDAMARQTVAVYERFVDSAELKVSP
jgi:glycosyltransferase involved in cell wall biosynthesis